MLKSRRGLLAAGLTVAVIGAIGVVSTLNAGAEQISDTPVATTAAATAAAAPALKPPPHLESARAHPPAPPAAQAAASPI